MGKTCNKCGLEKLFVEFSKHGGTCDGLQSQCKECKNILQIEYRKTGKGKAVEARYYQANKGRVKTEREKAIHNKANAKYGKSNKGKVARSEYSKTDKFRVVQSRYHQTEKGRVTRRNGTQIRRALKLGIKSEPFTDIEIFERDGYTCQLCKRKTRPDFKNQYHPLKPNLDHIIPISLGGEHTRRNTQCLCRHCNVTKNNTGMGDQLRMFG